jgi:preprotein translocase subunit SecY
LGTLLYAVVMGFFNDYTELVDVASFSTLFMASLVMQALTFATFGLKNRVSSWYRGRAETNKIAHGLSIWAVLFVSKFVYLEVINIIFGSAVEISGFVGLVLIIAVMVIVGRLIVLIDQRLSDSPEVTTLAI